MISKALHIVQTLNRAGFLAYYAGGWVRDFLLNHPSDDIDIATNAPPETVQALFPKTIPIGIAFGIILVVFDDHQYEVATFRRDFDYADGRRPQRVEFSDAEEDAKRRDFTINGMFYDPIQEKVIDYVGGTVDLEAGVIRAIGNPHERIREDRLRMIRGIRLSCRFNFIIEEKTAEAIRAHADELFPSVAVERVWQELEKGHRFIGSMLQSLHEFGLLSSIFPQLKEITNQTFENRLKPILRFPIDAPLIASIWALFPDMGQEAFLDLCKRMKLSNRDLHLAALLFRSHELVQREKKKAHVVESFEWAQLYAHPDGWMALQVLSCWASSPQQWLDAHEKRRQELAPFVERIRMRNPVVTSNDLLAEGIPPGKEMGRLLREAERISCNLTLLDPREVIAHLKQHSFWPS